MAYIRSFKTQTTLSEYIAGPFTITQIPQNIDVETITVSTAVKLYRGLIYEKITTSTDDPGTIAKLLGIINELEEGSSSAGGFGGLFKIINLGTANGIHKETVNGEARLKSIRAGSNIVVSANDNEITITGTTPPVSVPIDSIDNVGPLSAAGIYKDISGQTARLRRISAGDNVTIVQNADDITINAVIPPIPSQGVVSGQNVGNNTGYGVFKDVLNTTTARFKRIIPGNNITMSSTDDDITINAVVPVITPATVTNLANVGSMSSVGVFKQLSSTVGQFYKLKAGNNASIVLDGDDIVISAVPGEGAAFASGQNTGTGEASVYKNTVGSNLVFKTLHAGPNIVLTDDGDTITIEAETGGAVTLDNIVSDGTLGSVGVTNGVTGSTAHFKGIKGGANVSVTEDLTDITIAATFDGMTSGQNDGDGAGKVFKSVTGGVGSYRSIKAGTGVSISQDANNIVIDAAGGSSGVTTVTNNGSGSGIGMDVTGPVLNLKSIKAGANITVTAAADEIVIGSNMDLTGAVTALQNVDGGDSYDARVFKNTTAGVASMRSIKAGTNVSIVEGPDIITINASGGSSTSFVNDGDGVGKVYKSTSGTDIHLRSIKAGSNISIAQDTNNIVISATGGGGGGSGTATGFNDFDTGTSYASGDVVIRNNAILRAKEAVTAGAFNPAQWDVLGDGAGYAEIADDPAFISNAITPQNGFATFIPNWWYPPLFTESNPYERTLTSGQFCWIGKTDIQYDWRRKHGEWENDWFEISIDAENTSIDRFINICFVNPGDFGLQVFNTQASIIQENMETYLDYDGQFDSFHVDLRMGKMTSGDLIMAHRSKHYYEQEVDSYADRMSIVSSTDDMPWYLTDEIISPSTPFIGLSEFNKIGVFVQSQSPNNGGNTLIRILGYNSTTQRYVRLCEYSLYSRCLEKINYIPIISTIGYDITVKSAGEWDVPDSIENAFEWGYPHIAQNFPDWASFELIDPEESWSGDEAYGYDLIANNRADSISNAPEVFFDRNNTIDVWYDVYGCTKEVGEPDICGESSYVRISWFKFTIDRSLNVSFLKPGVDMVLEVFSGGPSYGSLVSELQVTTDSNQDVVLDAGTYYVGVACIDDADSGTRITIQAIEI